MTATAAPDDERAAARPRRRPGVATVALLTALLALLSGAIGLVFDLWPGLRPDPRSNHSGALSVYSVERDVPVSDWLPRLPHDEVSAERRAYLAGFFVGQPRPTRAQIRGALASQGEVFYVNVRIEGFKRQTLTLRWSMYSSARRHRLTTEGISRNTTGAFVVGSSPSDTAVVPVWTPQVVVRGMVFARFELVDRAGTILAVADSPRFPGLRGA